MLLALVRLFVLDLGAYALGVGQTVRVLVFQFVSDASTGTFNSVIVSVSVVVVFEMVFAS